MADFVKLNIYLSEHKRKQYIFIYNKLQEKYAVAMDTLFGDIEGAADKHRDNLAATYSTAYNYEFVDPGDIFENIEFETVEFYNSEKLMQYNFHLSLLATAYQIFEQQLRGFLYAELNHTLSPVSIKEAFKDFGTNMGKLKDEYKDLGYDLEATAQWKDIELLADVVNTYKHGDGRSAERLYRNSPEMFLKGFLGDTRIMDRELTTNAEIVFDLEVISFDKYTNAIIEFWEAFPEYLEPTVEVE